MLLIKIQPPTRNQEIEILTVRPPSESAAVRLEAILTELEIDSSGQNNEGLLVIMMQNAWKTQELFPRNDSVDLSHVVKPAFFLDKRDKAHEKCLKLFNEGQVSNIKL